MKTIELSGIEVSFAANHVLKGVDLHCRKGEVMMLVGPNGAGKSTLIKVVLGLVKPQKGGLIVDGQPTRPNKDFKHCLGYLPEAVAFPENLSGRQVLRFFASARGLKRRRIDEVLERIGLIDAAKRCVRTYSRGMRQRLGLGIAILSEPELLILDEPTGGLDQQGLTVLWSVLEEWREKERFVLVSSHDLTLMEHRIDRLCLIVAGKVRAEGTPAELRGRAGLPIKVDFDLFGDGCRVHLFLDQIRSWDRVSSFRHEGKRLMVEIPPDALLELMNQKHLDEETVSAIRVNEPGLDDVYESLLREVS